MKPDDFEQQLARTPLGEPPAEWRATILGAARAAAPSSRAAAAAPAPAAGRESGWRAWWHPFRSRWLPMGPSPWAALAGAAAGVIALAGVGSGLESAAAAATGSVSMGTTRGAVVAAGRHYRAEIIELVNHDRDNGGDGDDPASAPPPANGDRPRSERGTDPRGLPRWFGGARMTA